MKQALVVTVVVVTIAFLALFLLNRNDQPAVTDVDTPDVQVPDTGPDENVESDEEASPEAVEVVEESAAEPSETDQSAILLARADVPSSAKSYQYKEGKNYVRLVPSQPTIGGADKVEVAEFFWYGCPHCLDLEPVINPWAENAPANVRFVRVPAMWNQVVRVHAQLFYTEEVLVRNGVIKDPEGFRATVFEEYNSRGNRLLSVDAIRKLFARYGVSEEEFDKTWGSFEVAQKLRVAEDLARRYSIASVPTIVVNGKYRTSAQEAGGYTKLIEVIDELVDRETTE